MLKLMINIITSTANLKLTLLLCKNVDFNINTTIMCTFGCCIGVNGQSFNVSIVVDPSMASYTVGDNLTLTCMVDPMPNSTASAVTYSWSCSGCFADGMNSPVISQVLTDMDSGSISCSVDINGTVQSDMFDLQIQGTYVVSYLGTIKCV